MTPNGDSSIGVSYPGREVQLDVKHSSPPVAAYVGINDTLWIMTSTSLTTPSLIISARLLMPNGDIVPNQWVVTAPSQRAAFYSPITLPECFILSLSIASNLSSDRRTIFTAAIISRGLPASGVQSQVLCQGYTNNAAGISYPQGVNTNNLDCVGQIRSITGTTPGVGAEISETVPSNVRWRLIAFRYQLTSSATVANRTPTIALDDGTNIFWSQYSTATQTATLTWTYAYATGLAGQLGGPSNFSLQLPAPLILMPGYRIRTITGGLQVNDQYTAPQYLVEEWLCP